MTDNGAINLLIASLFICFIVAMTLFILRH